MATLDAASRALSRSCCAFLEAEACADPDSGCPPELCNVSATDWSSVSDKCTCASFMGPSGLLPYLEWHWCDFSCSAGSEGLAYAVTAAWLLFLFSMVASTADEYMVPNLERLSTSMRLSPNVAGVTLLALGNGAPDFFTSLAAFRTTDSSSIGLGSMFGGGIFITSLVLGSVSLVRPFTSNRRPLLRDVVWYMGATGILCVVCLRGYATTLDAALLVGIYVLYVLVVTLGRLGYQRLKGPRAAWGGSAGGDKLCGGEFFLRRGPEAARMCRAWERRIAAAFSFPGLED